MSSNNSPIPANEMDRILNLYEFDIDYSNLESTFKDLTRLAAKITGADISLINLIDTYTQWSVSNFGLDIDQMERKDSVCQYTLLEQEHFEVEDLSLDTRFQDKFYVDSPLNLRYYFGVPLKTNSGHHIGALCVLDKSNKKLTEEMKEQLKIIANEIITKLNTIKVVKDLKDKITVEQETKKRVAHDIRGPIGGIIGISDVILEDSKEQETIALANMINSSGNAVLNLADEILNEKSPNQNAINENFNLSTFREKLEKLYAPQATAKEITFEVTHNTLLEAIPFKRDKLLQITGNLISNAIKFTPAFGTVDIQLDIQQPDIQQNLTISISDSGLGIDEQSIETILHGKKSSTLGTNGELGYGFGLPMVKDLVTSINGKLNLTSTAGQGTTFEVVVPI